MRRLVSLAALAAGCGGAPTLDAPVAPPERIDVVGDAGLEVPATRWVYHPREMAATLGGWPLRDGSWLLVGELGERWRTDRLPDAPLEEDSRVYHAQASPHRAPEPLERVLPWTGEQFLLVGASGTLYTAATALGPLAPSAAPPVSLHAVAGNAKGLVGLGPMGKVYAHDGKSWRGDGRDACAACNGCGRCGTLFDVAALPGGQLLALGYPESLIASRDGGASWRAIDLSSFGARRLSHARDGSVLVEGAGKTMAWKGGDKLEIAKPKALRMLPAAAGFQIAPLRGPRAIAIEERQAALSGEHYYEVFGAEGGDERGWWLASGELGAPLVTRKIDLDNAPCDSIRLAARDRHLLLACLREEAGVVRATLFRSRDGGRKLRRVATLEAPDEGVELAVGGGGGALVAGVCLPTKEADEACKPRAPVRLTTGKQPLAIAAAGELVDAASAPVFSADGRSAYFLGRRAKDERMALFVSHDGGASFASRALSPPRDEPAWDVEVDAPRRLLPGADGELGLVVDSAPPLYALADREGRIVQLAQLPEDATDVSGFGRAILAVAGRSHDGGPMMLAAWESSDGGISFHEVAIPMRLEIDEFSDPLAVECAAAGCVIGSRATRVGWNQPEEGAVLAPPASGADAPLQPALRTPIACVVDEPMTWTTIRDVEGPVLPTASQAMRGKSSWSTLRHVLSTSEVVAMSAPRGPARRAEAQVLLRPARKRRSVADDVTRQMEGYAAVRVRLPGDAVQLRGDPATLEVAWINYLTGHLVRTALPQAAQSDPRDVTPGERPHLITGLVSVSPLGMFLQPSAQRDEVMVLDRGGNIVQRAAYPSWPATSAESSQSDAVLVGSHALAVGMHAWTNGAAQVVSLAPLDGSQKPLFVTVAPSATGSRLVETAWSYAGGDVGIVVTVHDPRARVAQAFFSAFAAGGMRDRQAVPTQLDVAAPASVCSEEQRRTSARVNAPFVEGTRHPVLVRTPSSTHVMITARAVLHGTPEVPCVAGWHAESVRDARESLAAIIPGDLTHAWLFRPTPDSEQALDYLPMRCELAPSQPVPDSLWREPGTVRR
jgi:hypothetical protein